MKGFIQSTIRFLFVPAVLMVGGILPSFAADLQRLSNGRLINDPVNDGDSFLVETNGRSFHVRLYFIDCPEISTASNADAQRVREQTRYFGLSDAAATIHFGNEAKIFVERILSKPFTIYTAFASGLGRSSRGRIYAFITAGDGSDLASLLVKNGLARTHGVRRKTPDGVLRDEMIERLRDFEISAMLKRIGIWSKSNPDRIAELRARQRSEEHELKEIQRQAETKGPQGLLDVNTASEKELQSIKGIGPVLAKRIIAARPYKTLDDLLKVKGIGPEKLEKIRPYFKILGT